MSFVTTARGGATGEGFATPPDPSPHSGAATSAATAGVSDHRAQCIIPTSVEVRRLFPSTERKSHVHIASGSGLIIAPRHEVGTNPDRARVDRYVPHVLPVVHDVEPHVLPKAYTCQRALPA